MQSQIPSQCKIDSVIYKEQQGESQQLHCRICLCSEEQTKQRLIIICQCKGTLQFVHQSCYCKWVESQIKTNTQAFETISKSSEVVCELCKKSISLSLQNKYLCEKKKQISRQDRIINIVFTITAIANFCVIIFLGTQYNKHVSDINDLVIIILIVILLTFGVILVCLILFNLFVRVQVKVSLATGNKTDGSRKSFPKLKKNRIKPEQNTRQSLSQSLQVSMQNKQRKQIKKIQEQGSNVYQ